jgi:ACS family pantothenate transporter-like MFS transporter
MSWANEICGADAEERALVLGIMNATGYAFNAWLPILVYPVKDAPVFRKGFVYSTVAFAAQFGITGTVWWLQRLEGKRKKMANEEDEVER